MGMLILLTQCMFDTGWSVWRNDFYEDEYNSEEFSFS